VRDQDALLSHVASLALRDWGVAERIVAPMWGQTKRLAAGWIVEVNGVPGPECYARRVVRDDGVETFTAATAAHLLWRWLRGGVPAGHSLRDLRRGE